MFTFPKLNHAYKWNFVYVKRCDMIMIAYHAKIIKT